MSFYMTPIKDKPVLNFDFSRVVQSTNLASAKEGIRDNAVSLYKAALLYLPTIIGRKMRIALRRILLYHDVNHYIITTT